MNDADITSRLEFAVRIARDAGEHTLRHYRSAALSVERKGDGSPVTQADKDAEQLLRMLIAERFTDDAILGEEFGESPGTSGFNWILDPIDGTKSFISGVPLYTTLVAVMRGNEPLIGVIFAPAVNELVYAARGHGCWHIVDSSEPRRAQVSQVSSLDEAIFLTTCVRSFAYDRATDEGALFNSFASSCRVVRTWGDAFGYLLVATGRAEIMIDPVMNLWDAAALQPIIEEAGGEFFDWQGQSTVHSGEAVATNASLAPVVRELIARYKARDGSKPPAVSGSQLQ